MQAGSEGNAGATGSRAVNVNEQKTLGQKKISKTPLQFPKTHATLPAQTEFRAPVALCSRGGLNLREREQPIPIPLSLYS